MKKISSGIIGLAIVIGLTGCGGVTWMNINKTPAKEIKIQEAEKKCSVNKKLYNLSIEKDGTYDMISILNAEGKAKEDLIKLYKQKENKVHSEINKCMKQEGLIKQQ